MGKIVAIGGGEMGRTKVFPDGRIVNYPLQTVEIDMAIVNMANKVQPHLLFISTASQDKQSYVDLIYKYFGEKLGCLVDDLQLIMKKYTDDEIRQKIDMADIIYVGGGDTRLMIDIWKRYQVDVYLKEAYEKGTVLAGLSAGAICWFEFYDNTDYMEAENIPLALLQGLGFISGFAVPHFDVLSSDLKKDICSMLEQRQLQGYGIDECAALVYDDGNLSILSSQEGKTVVKLP